MNEILNRINALRERKGWSQYELAKQTGISPNTVYSWSRIGTIPSFSNIERICETVGITTEQFFCDEGTITEEQKQVLADWITLSDVEKQAILEIIAVFKTLKV